MRLSRFFLPTMKEIPAEAQIASHRLMLRAGMIRQSSAGIYSWLPLGLRVLRKIEGIVREEQDRIGCQELILGLINNTPTAASKCESQQAAPGMATGVIMVSPPH